MDGHTSEMGGPHMLSKLCINNKLMLDKFFLFVVINTKKLIGSGDARGHPDRGSSFLDRGAEVSAGSTLPCKLPPPTSSHHIYCEVEAQLTSCMRISRN